VSWSHQAQTDWAYLRTHVTRAELEYADFREQGWPIGSGQVEGANKSVINAGMDRGCMFWSRSGIGRMAAQEAVNRPLAKVASMVLGEA
jgi:hypothetical protein